MNSPTCISGERDGRACGLPAAEGFDYCGGCGTFLGGYWMQLAPDHPDRAKMDAERAADRKAAGFPPEQPRTRAKR